MNTPTTTPAPDTLTLVPFEDGTVVKYLPRAGFAGQAVIVNAQGSQLAVTRTESIAEMLCDGTNVLFRALDQKQEIELEQTAQDIARLHKPVPPTDAELAAQKSDPEIYAVAAQQMLDAADKMEASEQAKKVRFNALYQAALANAIFLLSGKKDLGITERYAALLQAAAIASTKDL